jgi:GntP family gluconate:H+ symporter
LIDKLGEKRAPLALGIASLLFGLPIFFDAAFMVMLPLYLAVARRLGGSMLMYVLPPAAALSTMHVFMPPHPGVVTAGVLLGADVGLVMLLGLLIAIPTWLIAGMLYGTFIGKRIVLPIPELIAGGPMIDDDSEGAQNPPKVITLLGLLFLPLVLIFGNLLATTLAKTGSVDKDATWVGALQLIGSIPIALLITVLVSSWLLGLRRGRSREVVEDLLDKSLKPIASVLLVTGAGGMFSAVLMLSGIGDALADTLQASGLPLAVAVFFISGMMRMALGGTTIAITTAAGLLGGVIMDSGLSPLQNAAIVLVLAGGSAILPHVNDPTFWLIGRLLGMDVIQTLKTWTVLKTLMGTVGAVFASAVFYLV